MTDSAVIALVQRHDGAWQEIARGVDADAVSDALWEAITAAGSRWAADAYLSLDYYLRHQAAYPSQPPLTP